MPSLSIVIPVYNSAEILPALAERLYGVLEKLEMPFEVILINDGSRDDSWEAIVALLNRYGCMTGINLMRNYGQHNALLCGIRAAQNDVIVTMDDDLQNPPEEIPRLLEKLAEGYDVVYGTPERETHSVWRNIASRLTKHVLQKAMGAETATKISAFRAFHTRLREAFSNYQNSYVSIDVLLTWATTRFTLVHVQQHERQTGQSNYTVKNLIIHTLNMVTGFSVLPLQIASVMGFLFTIFGGLILGYVLLNYLFRGASVPGFAFLASLIAIFSGVQLFSLGMIGEYLSRMHFRIMDRPNYAVSDYIHAQDRGQTGHE